MINTCGSSSRIQEFFEEKAMPSGHPHTISHPVSAKIRGVYTGAPPFKSTHDREKLWAQTKFQEGFCCRSRSIGGDDF